jgi:predicted TIM-barrel fold metal-dependent hydrolase
MTSESAQYVDVHQHFVPPAYRQALADSGLINPIPGVDYPQWSAEEALAMLDRRGIAVGMLSITEPGVHFADNSVARRLAREVNEFAANLIREHPGRFGAFATLPLPDVDGALAELAYALDELKLDGVGLMTNYRGLYLGDAETVPVLEEANRRGAPVFVHPSTPPNFEQVAFGLPVSLYEFTFDTTRMVANLLYAGVLDRLPDLNLILSHAGGTIPFLAQRLTYGATISAGLADRAPDEPIASLRRLYYDTAMSANEFALPSLRALVDPTHILLGTDYPFMPEQTTVETLAGIEGFDGFNEVTGRGILRDNSLPLFPRLRNELLSSGAKR